MKRHYLLTLGAIFLFCIARGQQLNAAEYFFDTDPGVGNGTSISVIQGDSISWSGTIPVPPLNPGFHFLFIRSRDVNGTWSLSERRMFYTRTPFTAPALTQAEYFFDTDPGVGNGTALAVSAGDTISFSGTIPSGALGDGFHFLYIRSAGSDGIWSLAERRMIFIQSVRVAAVLTAAEYFIDTDPGTGNGTALAVSPGDSITFSGVIPVASTGPGFHFLYIRTRDAQNIWSISERRMFYVDPVLAVQPALVAAEYFIDTDPGVGNGLPLTVTAGDTINFSGTLPVASVVIGYHVLGIRVRDAQDKWSLYETRDFEISTTGGIHELDASGGTQLFQNYPNPFSGSTSIDFYLQDQGDAVLYISDYLGRIVNKMEFKNAAPGFHSVKTDDVMLTDAYYICKLVSGKFTGEKKMLRMKQ